MIHVAREEDLKLLSRRKFLGMFTTAAPAAVIAPRKTFVFFGNILRPAPAVVPVNLQNWITMGGLSAIIGAVMIGGGLSAGGLKR